MTPNEIESLKEEINFLTRIMLAYIAGVYLLVGAAGNYLREWLASDELLLSEFGIIPAATAVVAVALASEALRLRWKIMRLIKRIRETP